MKSCTPAELKLVQDGKKTTLKGYEVVLEDTVLFPEGGGQVYFNFACCLMSLSTICCHIVHDKEKATSDFELQKSFTRTLLVHSWIKSQDFPMSDTSAVKGHHAHL